MAVSAKDLSLQQLADRLAGPRAVSTAVAGEVIDPPAGAKAVDLDPTDFKGLLAYFQSVYPNHLYKQHKQMAAAIVARNPIALQYAFLGHYHDNPEDPTETDMARARKEVMPHWLAAFPPEDPEPTDPTELEIANNRIAELEAKFELLFQHVATGAALPSPE